MSENKFTNEQLLDYSQNLRKRFVDELTSTELPKDNEERALMLVALKDIDRTALGRIKAEISKEDVGNARLAQEIVARMLKIEPHGLSKEEGGLPPIAPDIASLPTLHPKEVEEEGHVGLIKEDSKSFLSRIDEK